MPNIQEVVFNFVVDGMNDSVHPTLLQRTNVARMTNCQIKNQLPTTRHGFRALPLGPDADEFRTRNIQGAAFYNPTLGASQQSFGADQASIVCSAGGRKYHISFGVSGITSVSDETNGVEGIDTVHLAWLYQAENYMLCQDGASQTWIWDGTSPAVASTGYNSDEPEKSKLPNAATAGAYAHGRIVTVVDGKKIIVGDILHKNNLTNPKNILNTSEQNYYATGAYFSPPSNLGQVMAIAILPLRNTQHGHDDVLIHCKYGVFSLKIDVYPRSAWSEQAISKHLLLDTAAVGPYAVVLYDGDQMFRSRNGVQTIRSAAAQADVLGNPQQAVSEAVRTMFDGDHPTLLRFASMSKWAWQHRAFCTAGLWVDGAHRGGSGMVVLNMMPQGSFASETRAWEGMWTFPHGYSKPVQLLNGLFGDNDRMLVFCTEKKGDGYYNSLVEVDPNLKHDVMEDGSTKDISSQIITRCVPGGDDNHTIKIWHNGRIIFRNVQGCLEWGVWCRRSEAEAWIPWNSGRVVAPDQCDTADCLVETKSHTVFRNLGDVPREMKNATLMQLLIRWRGYAQVEAVRIGVEMGDANDTTSAECEELIEATAPCDYSDFEYSEEEPSWQVQ